MKGEGLTRKVQSAEDRRMPLPPKDILTLIPELVNVLGYRAKGT